MEDLRRVFGDDFLAFVLNLPAPEGLTETQLTTEQRGAVTEVLEPLASAVLAGGGPMNQQHITARVMTYLPDKNTTIACYLRQQCGGEVVQAPGSSDPIARDILRLAQDVYPSLLLPMEEHNVLTPFVLTVAATNHPVHREILETALNDEELLKLLPGAPVESALDDSTVLTNDVKSDLYLSHGAGGTFQLVGLPTVILRYSYERCLLADQLGLSAFLDEVTKTVDGVRRLARGRSMTVPFVVGLAHIRLPDDLRLSFPWGQLRAVRRPHDTRFIRYTPTASTIFVAETKLKIVNRRAFNPSPSGAIEESQHQEYRSLAREWHYQAERMVNLTRLSLLLASNDDQMIAAEIATSTALDPIQQGGFSGVKPYLYSYEGEVHLTQDTAQRALDWASRIAAHHPQTLDVSMSRLLLVNSRPDPYDALIDAVIVWENMFGAKEEAGLRVRASLAHLLEPHDLEKRKALAREVGTIYDVRSRIVHGSATSFPDIDEVYRHRNRATQLALDAMRRLYDHLDILEASDSGSRSNSLLLGAVQRDSLANTLEQ
jgi:hypothetical protein